jgi:hypothetical protein
MVRWKIVTEARTWEAVGRLARPGEWLWPWDPFLLVAPGQTNQTNVLAFIAVHVRWRESSAFLVRRRSYEEEPLEWEPLGSGPLTLTVEPLEE